MITENKHITGYSAYWRVLIFLLAMTFLTVTVTWINLSALTVLMALIIATFKAGTVLTYFMHLRYESSLFKILVSMVLAVYVLVIILTFSDYLFR